MTFESISATEDTRFSASFTRSRALAILRRQGRPLSRVAGLIVVSIACTPPPQHVHCHGNLFHVLKHLLHHVRQLWYVPTYVQGLADARKRARRSGLVQFFAVYQFDRGGILQMCHTVGELCNHAVRGSMVWRQTSDTIEFCILITCCILITA